MRISLTALISMLLLLAVLRAVAEPASAAPDSENCSQPGTVHLSPAQMKDHVLEMKPVVCRMCDMARLDGVLRLSIGTDAMATLPALECSQGIRF